MRWVISMLRKSAAVHIGLLKQTVALTLVLVALLSAVLILTVLFAKPSAEQIATIIAEGGRVGGSRMVGITAWSLLPIGFMVVGALVFAGTIQRQSAARLRGLSSSALTAARVTLGRIGQALITLAALVVTIGLLIVLAPVVSLVALLVLAVRPWLVKRARFRKLPSVKALAALVIPCAAAWALALKWVLALPLVAVEGLGWREALRQSWRRTTGAVKTVGIAMTLAVVIALVGSYAVMSIGAFIGVAVVSAVLDVVGGVVFGVFPFVCAAVAHLGLGGSLTGQVEPARGDRLSVALRPAAVSLAVILTATALTPAPSAQANDAPDPRIEVSVGLWTQSMWNLGGGVSDAEVEVNDVNGPVDGGVSRLFQVKESGTVFISEAPVVNGLAAHDLSKLVIGLYTLRAEYSGSDTHRTGTSNLQHAEVVMGELEMVLSVVGAGPSPRIGDTVTVRAAINTADVVEGTDPGSVRFYDSGANAELGTVPFVNGVAEIAVMLTKRELRLFAEVQSDDYFGGGEHPPLLENIEPFTLPVTITAPGSIGLGQHAQIGASVVGPTGMQVGGKVFFEYLAGSTWMPLGSADLIQQTAAISVCAGSCGASFAELPFGALTDPDVSVRARYTPLSNDPELWLFSPTESAAKPIGVHDPVTGPKQCMRVLFSSSISQVDSSVLSARAPRTTTGTNCLVSTSPRVEGYKAGTTLIVHAPAATETDFVSWEVGQQTASTDSSFVFTVPAENPLWWEDANTVRVHALYELKCHPLAASIEGSGRWDGYAATDNRFGLAYNHIECRTAAGQEGLRHGSVVVVGVVGTVNSETGEKDTLYSAGSARFPLTPVNSSNRWAFSHSRGGWDFTYTLDRPFVPTFVFGPVCRSLETESSENARLDVLTSQNCKSPVGDGYIRNTEVQISAEVTNPETALVGWTVNGEAQPQFGNATQVAIEVGEGPLTNVGVDLVTCYTIGVAAESGPIGPGRDGRPSVAEIHTEFNCPDGTDRYMEGTEVTLVSGSGRNPDFGEYWFGVWSDSDQLGDLPTRGSDPTRPLRTVVADGNFVATAHYYLENLCSTIKVQTSYAPALDLTDFRVNDTGCGPGRYFDRAKGNLSFDIGIGEGPTAREFHLETGEYPYTQLRIKLVGDTQLVTGLAEMTTTIRGTKFRSTERANFDCDPQTRWCDLPARGDVTLSVNSCQGVQGHVAIIVEGDESGRVFRPGWELADHQWLTTEQFSWCAREGTQFPIQYPAGTPFTIRTLPPAVGYEFLGWGEHPQSSGIELFGAPRSTTNPSLFDRSHPLGLMLVADDADQFIDVAMYYKVHCAEVTLGVGISIGSPQPNCPAQSPSGKPTYIIGTFLDVVADRETHRGEFENFRNGVIAGTVGSLPDGRTAGIALVDGDITINAAWLSDNEKFISQLASTGKLFAGIAALGVAVGVGVACPPCGVALTVLTASTFLLDLIPGMGGMATAVLSAINPLSILECAAEWGIRNNGGEATDTSTLEGAGATVSTTARSVKFAWTAFSEGSDAAITNLKTRSWGTLGGSTIGMAGGLWENRIHEWDHSYQSVSDLRGTGAWTSCLEHKYRAFS